MEEFYVKETKILETTQEEQEKDLINSIIETKKNLDMAHRNFEFANEDLIDYYSYQIKANLSKLNYLTKIAKSRGIVMNVENKLNFNLKTGTYQNM